MHNNVCLIAVAIHGVLGISLGLVKLKYGNFKFCMASLASVATALIMSRLGTGAINASNKSWFLVFAGLLLVVTLEFVFFSYNTFSKCTNLPAWLSPTSR